MDTHVVVLFDGVCNLCSASVQFLLARDAHDCFRFASLQSAAGQALLNEYGLAAERLESVVAIEGGVAYTRSAAALHIARHLPPPWCYAWVLLRWLPRRLRDAVYNVVARSRYRVFGRRTTCWLPTLQLRHRFLDQAGDPSAAR